MRKILMMVAVCPCAVWAVDWTGEGGNTTLTTTENWSETPDLTGGTAVMQVTGGTAATLPADGTAYAFKGVAVGQADFTFNAETGANALTLGAFGLTNMAAGVTWAWPVTLGAAAWMSIPPMRFPRPSWAAVTAASWEWCRFISNRAPVS